MKLSFIKKYFEGITYLFGREETRFYMSLFLLLLIIELMGIIIMGFVGVLWGIMLSVYGAGFFGVLAIFTIFGRQSPFIGDKKIRNSILLLTIGFILIFLVGIIALVLGTIFWIFLQCIFTGFTVFSFAHLIKEKSPEFLTKGFGGMFSGIVCLVTSIIIAGAGLVAIAYWGELATSAGLYYELPVIYILAPLIALIFALVMSPIAFILMLMRRDRSLEVGLFVLFYTIYPILLWAWSVFGILIDPATELLSLIPGFALLMFGGLNRIGREVKEREDYRLFFITLSAFSGFISFLIIFSWGLIAFFGFGFGRLIFYIGRLIFAFVIAVPILIWFAIKYDVEAIIAPPPIKAPPPPPVEVKAPPSVTTPPPSTVTPPPSPPEAPPPPPVTPPPPPAKNYCPKCGQRVKPDSRFCGNCGSRL